MWRDAGSFAVSSQGRDKKIRDHILRTWNVFHFLEIIIGEKLTQTEDTLQGKFLRKQKLQTVMVRENFKLYTQK